MERTGSELRESADASFSFGWISLLDEGSTMIVEAVVDEAVTDSSVVLVGDDVEEDDSPGVFGLWLTGIAVVSNCCVVELGAAVEVCSLDLTKSTIGSELIELTSILLIAELGTSLGENSVEIATIGDTVLTISWDAETGADVEGSAVRVI